jgi:hypothetical protein
MTSPNQIDVKQLRAFGLLVGGIFVVIGVWPILLRGEPIRSWVTAIALPLILLALVWPSSLAFVYREWMRLARILEWINSRIILGTLFYLLITPLGILKRRLLGKDALERDIDPRADTYRVPSSPRPSSHLKNQF